MAATRSESRLEVLKKTMNTVQGTVEDIRERMESLTKVLAAMAGSQTRMEANQTKLEQWIYNTRGYQRGDEVQGEHPSEEEETRGSNRDSKLSGEGELQHALKRGEIPGFNGVDPRGWHGKAVQYRGRKATNPFEALASLRQDRPVEDRMGEAQNQKGTKGRYDLPLLHLDRNEDVSGPANTSTQAQQSMGQTLINASGSSQTGGSLGEVVVNWKWKQNGKPITVGLDYNGQGTSSPSFLTSPNQFVDKIPVRRLIHGFVYFLGMRILRLLGELSIDC
ncbi:hypothetical protein F511_26244 [Dorcoceras hygrometricum]|uniref:Uncharacterized protein n=1 Tax=Dorcoceras hygrometricum TaxID=472368 RepID=A0A2Z7AIC0_9LAMI|nr:hypothetical protein F511_26244 [Dorcoceras hygrometricum]